MDPADELAKMTLLGPPPTAIPLWVTIVGFLFLALFLWIAAKVLVHLVRWVRAGIRHP